MFRKKKIQSGFSRYFSNVVEKLKTCADSNGSTVSVSIRIPSDSPDRELPPPENFSLTACLSANVNITPVNSKVLIPSIDSGLNYLTEKLSPSSSESDV